MIDRVTRIAPPYVLLTLVVYLGARFIPGAFPNMKTSLPHALLSAAFIPHISPQGTTFPQVIPGWTLNYEIFFYVIFALCLGCAPRLRLIVLTALLTGLAAASFVLPITNTAEATYTDPLLLEFVAGLWLGAAWQHRVLPSTVWGYAALAAGIGGFAVWQSLSSVAPEHSRCLVWGIPAALVVAGAVTIEARRGMPTVPPLLVLGDASFSIYLVNVFVVAAVWRLMERAPVPLYCTAAMIATAVIGIVFWRAVERPLTRAARHWVHRPAPGPTQVAILHPVLQEGG
jgi:exopolysaccharide production protein ExoZ